MCGLPAACGECCGGVKGQLQGACGVLALRELCCSLQQQGKPGGGAWGGCSALFAPNLPMHRTSGKKNKKTDGTSVEGLRSDAQLGHAATAPLSKELRPCFTGSTSLHGLQVPQSSRAGGGSCKTYQENNLEHPWNVSRVYLRLFDGCECQEESYSVHGRCRL